MAAPIDQVPLSYEQFINSYNLEILREPADLSIIDGDLAITKDFDLMRGDISYTAMFRLADAWRFNSPHLSLLYSFVWDALEELRTSYERLDLAMEADWNSRLGADQLLAMTQEYRDAIHVHWNEEGRALEGHQTYAGCIVLMASKMLQRFRDDLDGSWAYWNTSGQLYGGYSVGQIIVAAANGFRHEDEWLKARISEGQHKRSQDCLHAALGESSYAPGDPIGWSAQALQLLSHGRGFDGFTETALRFAHEVALRRRAALGQENPPVL